MQIIALVALIAALAIGATGVGVGAAKSFNAQTRTNIAVYKLSTREVQGEELERLQRDTRTAPLEAVGGIAEAGISAQSLATPGVTPNPVGIGMGESWTFTQYAMQHAGDSAGSSAPSDPNGTVQAPSDAEQQGTLLGSGVDLATAPDDYYVGWYVVRDGERWLFVNRVAEYNRDQLMSDVFPWSNDDSPAVKVPITNASWSEGDILFALDDASSGQRRDGDRWFAQIAGVAYRCDRVNNLTDRWRSE